MRSHLLKCFQQRKMELFPIIRERSIRGSSVLSTDVIEVFCMCRMPEMPGSEWIECTKCKEWYHMCTCIVVPPRYLEDRYHGFALIVEINFCITVLYFIMQHSIHFIYSLLHDVCMFCYLATLNCNGQSFVKQQSKMGSAVWSYRTKTCCPF